MPETKKSWLVDAEGNYAAVEPGEIDTWIPRGWSRAQDGPQSSFVWLQHEVHGGKAKFPVAAVANWESLGWHPAAPPEPVDVTKDPVLVDVADEPPSSKKTKSATSGETGKE